MQQQQQLWHHFQSSWQQLIHPMMQASLQQMLELARIVYNSNHVDETIFAAVFKHGHYMSSCIIISVQVYYQQLPHASILSMPSVLWCCWLGGRKGIQPVKKQSGGVLAWLSVWSNVQPCTRASQLTPLPLTVSCFSEIQTGFTFLVLAHLGSPGQRAVKRVCVCATHINDSYNSSAIVGSHWWLCTKSIIS